VPKGWTLPIRDVLIYSGAKFLCPCAGPISLMPGTGSNPAYRRVDVDPGDQLYPYSARASARAFFLAGILHCSSAMRLTRCRESPPKPILGADTG
jgi:hypothetical protein